MVLGRGDTIMEAAEDRQILENIDYIEKCWGPSGDLELINIWFIDDIDNISCNPDYENTEGDYWCDMVSDWIAIEGNDFTEIRYPTDE
jgi:hypothetical protein